MHASADFHVASMCYYPVCKPANPRFPQSRLMQKFRLGGNNMPTACDFQRPAICKSGNAVQETQMLRQAQSPAPQPVRMSNSAPEPPVHIR